MPDHKSLTHALIITFNCYSALINDDCTHECVGILKDSLRAVNNFIIKLNGCEKLM